MSDFNFQTKRFLKNLFPSLGGNWGEIDLEKLVLSLYGVLRLEFDKPNPFLDPNYCQLWINFLLKLKGIDYAFGGYMEDRSVLWRNHYHEQGCTHHVGVDYYVPLTSEVSVPVKSKLIHSVMDSDKNGGWGGKLTFQWDEGYYLMAHLDEISTDINRTFEPGDVVGIIGDADVNGGWCPHLHFQCLREPLFEIDGYMKLYDDIRYDFPNPMTVNWGLHMTEEDWRNTVDFLRCKSLKNQSTKMSNLIEEIYDELRVINHEYPDIMHPKFDLYERQVRVMQSESRILQKFGTDAASLLERLLQQKLGFKND